MPRLRIHNTTGNDVNQARVYAPTVPREPFEFGPIRDGEYSGYVEMPVAYPFAHVEVSGPTGHLSLRPYDYVGEEPLPEGRYSYRLGLVDGRLTLDLEPAADE